MLTTQTKQQGVSTLKKKSNQTGLPDRLKSRIESLSGYNMDDVRVHYNSSKPAQMKALAYTQGSNIHVASGQERYIPHEAWHVVQQKQGRVHPTMQLKGVDVNDDAALENEANVMGAKAVQLSENTDDNNLMVKRVEGGAIQAALPTGVAWNSVYNGIDDRGVLEGNIVRTVQDSKSLIRILTYRRNHRLDLENTHGLRRLAYDLSLAVKKAKDTKETGFPSETKGQLETARNKITELVKDTEDAKYSGAGYINEETDTGFINRKEAACDMIDKVLRADNKHFEDYFLPKGDIRYFFTTWRKNSFINEIKQNYVKIREYLKLDMDKRTNSVGYIGYKNSYSRPANNVAYVYPEKTPQPSGTKVGDKDVGGTYIKSKKHKGTETGANIRLSNAYRMEPDVRSASSLPYTKPGTIIHEASHLILGTKDYAYGDSNIKNLEKDKAIQNADTYRIAAETAP